MNGDRGGRRVHAAILLIAAVLFLLLLRRSYFGVEQPGPEVPAPVAVEITGEVPNPGAYLLERGRATVAEALASAGLSGFGADNPDRAEDGALWKSEEVKSGDSLHVVNTDSGPRVFWGQMRASARLAAGLKIDINSASAEDLMHVPQMRAEIAAAIVKRRLEKPWEKVADLVEIHGVGPKTAQRFEEFLEVRRY